MKKRRIRIRQILAIALTAVTVLSDTQNLIAYAAEYASGIPRHVNFDSPEPLTDLLELIDTEEDADPLTGEEIDELLDVENVSEAGTETAATEATEKAEATETVENTEETETTESVDSTEATETIEDTESTEAEETTETEEVTETPEKPLREPEIEKPDIPDGTLVSYTEDSATYALGDGRYQTVFGSNVGTYVNDSDVVCLADNTLRAVADDRADDTYYENTANDYDLIIPEDMSDGTGMVLEQNGYTMEVIPTDGDYTSPMVKENAIRYNDVYENVDVQYTVYDNSIKEDIILNAPTDRKSFSYRIKADGLTAVTGEGVIALQDAENNTVFVLDAPVMEDAAGEVSLGVVLATEQKGKDFIVTVTPDQDWLKASERSYPVKIDPSQIYVDNTKFGLYCVEEGSPRSVIGDNSYPYVGYDDGIVSGNRKNYGTAHLKCRTYIGIDYDFSELGEEAVIEDATFRICQTTHFGGGGNEIGLYTTDAAWTPKSLTWNSQADMSHTFLNSQKTTAKSKEWIEYDITDYVNDHAQGIAEDSGLVLKSIDENAQCEVFYNRTSSLYGPQIVVTWSENGDDPYLASLPLDGLTINVRPMNEKNINGKLTLDAVFADGLATAGAEVDYYLVGEGTKHTTTALKRYAYPNSIPFLEAFPNATRYKLLQSNWQSELYTGFTYNTIYQFRATAKKDGASSTEKASDTFLVYPVARFDTFPKIAAYYGVELYTILKDNRVQDSLVVAGNTIFVRNPATNVPYSPSDLTEAEMAAIDGLLMGRGLHCEFGFEPVNLNTGNFYMDAEDVSIPDIGGNFAINRSYNSKGASINSPFGRGWTFGADESLSMLEDGSVIYKKGDGSFYTMTPGEDGRYYAPAGYAYVLTPVYGENTENTEETDTEADGEGEVWEDEPSIVSWTLTDGDYQTHTFNAAGMLTSIADRHGNTTTVAYDETYHLSALTSPSGKTYSFTTDAQGRITSIALPNGAVLAYTYDAEGNLVTCQNANGNIIRYEYDDKHQMTAWYDANGNRVVKNTYDANGRVTEQIDANGNTSSLIYSAGKTETIDNMGNHTVYSYDAQYRTTAIHYADGTTVKKTYDEQKNINNTSAETVYKLSLYLNCDVNELLNNIAFLENGKGTYLGYRYYWKTTNDGIELHILDNNKDLVLLTLKKMCHDLYDCYLKQVPEMMIEDYDDEKREWETLL